MEQVRPGSTVFPFYQTPFAPNIASLTPDRFRFPLQPQFSFGPAAVFPGAHPAVISHSLSLIPQHPACAIPRMTTPTIAPVAPVPVPSLTFTQDELDMVLYGYTKGRTSERYHGHALSGLKFGSVSHKNKSIINKEIISMEIRQTVLGAGIEKILSGHRSSPDSSHNTSIESSCSNSETSHNITTRNHLSSSPLAVPQSPRKNNVIPLSVTGSSSSSSNNNNNNSKVGHGDHYQRSKPQVDSRNLELAEGLAIYQTYFMGTVHIGVFCTKTVIARGTRFGPFKGKVVQPSETKTRDDNSCMWEIFQEGKLNHFIDGRSTAGNWMTFVNCARYAQEQNLIAIQVDGEIYYEACKDIPQGTELLVWYGDCYLQFMGVPVALKEVADGGAQEEANTSEGFSCERCGKVFAYKYYRDKHLKYTRCVDQGDRKYPCHLCSRSFEKRDRLRIHILHVHEKHRPHKCLVCAKSFSQSSSLNKHMRVHSGERPYKCVYCNKAFTASSILRTHIRQHSGEKPFKCKHCGKAFASHAAHDSHVRRTHAKERPCACSICGKTFQQNFELKFHMGSHLAQ